MTLPNRLEIKNLSLSRGGRELLRDLSFSLNPGEWLHLHGDNGIGKTSLLRVICSLAPLDEGEVLWRGKNIHEDLPLYLKDIFFVGHKLALKEELTAFENLAIECALMGVPAQDLDLKQALAHFGLKGREHVPLGILSQGQKRRVALAKLKLARAPLWVLDEPLVALDSHTVDLFTQLLEQHLNSAGLVILTSHQPIQLSGLGRVLMLSK